MNFYDLFMVPLEWLYLKKIRRKIIPQATGRVLEIGFGTGANLPYYNYESLTELAAVDIKPPLKAVPAVKFYQASAESLPFEDNYFDYVITTLALCSVNQQNQTIQELYRVLKPNGKLIYLEHEQAKQPWLQKIFNKINPYWHKMTGNCQINLSTHQNISQLFTITDKQKGVFHYGLAQKAARRKPLSD